MGTSNILRGKTKLQIVKSYLKYKYFKYGLGYVIMGLLTTAMIIYFEIKHPGSMSIDSELEGFAAIIGTFFFWPILIFVILILAYNNILMK